MDRLLEEPRGRRVAVATADGQHVRRRDAVTVRRIEDPRGGVRPVEVQIQPGPRRVAVVLHARPRGPRLGRRLPLRHPPASGQPPEHVRPPGPVLKPPDVKSLRHGKVQTELDRRTRWVIFPTHRGSVSPGGLRWVAWHISEFNAGGRPRCTTGRPPLPFPASRSCPSSKAGPHVGSPAEYNSPNGRISREPCGTLPALSVWAYENGPAPMSGDRANATPSD